MAFLLASAAPVFAGPDISVSSDVVYKYDASGHCTVSHGITLTNGPSHVYPSSYLLSVSGPAPEDVSVTNAAGPVKFSIQNVSSLDSEITVFLTTPVVGSGNSQQFNIRYRCSPAAHRGQIWEIIIPKIKDLNFYDRYNLKIQTPLEFGELAFINPSGGITAADGYILNKNQLDNSPVNAVFGQFRTYAFNITYPLDNPGSSAKHVLIPLPADSSYQKVYYDSISLPPQNIRVGETGDWEAEFSLKPKSHSALVISGQVRILPSASSLPVILPHHSSSRKVIGLINNRPGQWVEYWDESQSAWYAPEFSVDRFYICTVSASCQSVAEKANFKLDPTVFRDYPRSLPQIRWRHPFQIFPFIKNRSYLEITNIQAQALYWIPVSVEANSVRITSPSAHNIPVIPPSGKILIPIDFSFSPLPDFSQHYLSVRAGSSLLTYNIPGILFLTWHVILTIIISAVFLLMAEIAVRSWSVHLQRQRGGHNLRRKS